MTDVNYKDQSTIGLLRVYASFSGVSVGHQEGATMAQAAKELEANQKLIERYRKLICQTCDGHGAVGNFLDSMNCPDCTALDNQEQEEIKALKIDLRKSQEFNCGLAQESNELKAQVEIHREALTMIAEQVKHGFVICAICSHQDSTEHHDTLLMAESTLNKTRQQCLADVKFKSFQDGAISMGCELVNEHESKFPGGEVQICAVVQIVTDSYAQQLRGKANG